MSEDATPTKHRTIGNMNGPWAILLRIALVSHPFVIGWLVWVTSEQFRDINHRENAVTKVDLNEKLSSLPSSEWKARVTVLEEQTAVNRITLAELTVKQSEALRSLERIERRLNNDRP